MKKKKTEIFFLSFKLFVNPIPPMEENTPLEQMISTVFIPLIEGLSQTNQGVSLQALTLLQSSLEKLDPNWLKNHANSNSMLKLVEWVCSIAQSYASTDK